MGHAITSDGLTEPEVGRMFMQRPLEPVARLSKITRELAILVAELERPIHTEPCAEVQLDRAKLSRTVRRYLKMRRERERLFPGLFGDPAWDMLLLLYVYRAANIPLQVSAIAGLANVAGTTSLRYLDLMIERELIVRSPDPHDRRRIWLVLTPKAETLIEEWLFTLQ